MTRTVGAVTELTKEEERVRGEALEFARKNKKVIAERLSDPEVFPPEEKPVSVFMAGSPGAGKTEASIELLNSFQSDGYRILRIDPDELRDQFPAYQGGKSWLFQPAVSVVVEKIHDLALKRKQSFILDGTFANFDKAKQNVMRSLKKKRVVQILYVYQEPMQAWQFVQDREALEGRQIRPEDFVDQYFAAREVVNGLKAELGRSIAVDLLLKNNDGTRKLYRAGIDRIDNHVPEKYDRAALERALGIR